MRLSSFLFFFSLLLFSCSTTKKIKDGTTAYEQKQYAVAIDMLESEIKQYEGGEEYARMAFLLGESYKKTNDSQNSLKWYIEAAKNEYGPTSYWEMAYALKKNERYQDAILSFKRLLKFSDRKNEIKLEIEKCAKALKWSQLQSEEPWQIQAADFNSDASDYAPSIWNDQLVFTSDRFEGPDEETYLWTGNAFADLYVSDIPMQNAQPLDGINTEHNEGTAVFTQDGLRTYFTRCHNEIGDSYCKIYTSELLNGEWIDQEPAFQMKPRVNYRDPVLIENDSVLIFVSDDPTGMGGSDLYYTFLNPDGTWEVPELMPAYLNSVGEERFPTWDGEYLYYSSDHFAGLGGLDILKTKLKEDNSWSKPANLLQPFNSSEDDYGYVVIPERIRPNNMNALVYFTSTRGIFGNDDIYEAAQLKSEEEMSEIETPVEEVVTEEVTKNQFIRVTVEEPIYAMPDNPNSFIVGKKKVKDASIKYENSSGANILITDGNGVVLIPVDSADNFTFLAGKKDYLNKSGAFDLSESLYDEKVDRYVHEVRLEIERIYDGVDITLENIYYDFNESFIREDAKPALNDLIEILKDNPAVSISLASHTDCRGDEQLNAELSQRRAAAAIEYIRDQGNISSERLAAIGYGKSQPEINCDCDSCTEDEHQINRRTTFAINQ